MKNPLRNSLTGIEKFSNRRNFRGFVLLVGGAGFKSPKQIGSWNALNFAYILYLTLLEKKLPVLAQEKKPCSTLVGHVYLNRALLSFARELHE